MASTKLRYNVQAEVDGHLVYLKYLGESCYLSLNHGDKYTYEEALKLVSNYKKLPWNRYYNLEYLVNNGNIRRLNFQIKRTKLDTKLPRCISYKKREFVIVVNSDNRMPEWVRSIEDGKVYLSQSIRQIEPLTREDAMFVIQNRRRYDFVSYKRSFELVNPRLYLKKYLVELEVN